MYGYKRTNIHTKLLGEEQYYLVSFFFMFLKSHAEYAERENKIT